MKNIIFLLLLASFAAVAKPTQRQRAALPEQQAAVLPLPQQLQWNWGYFPLGKATAIVGRQAVLRKEAERLAAGLRQRGKHVRILDGAAPAGPYIELSLRKLEVPKASNEACSWGYRRRRCLSGNSSQGILNGLQTLFQLIQGGDAFKPVRSPPGPRSPGRPILWM